METKSPNKTSNLQDRGNSSNKVISL